MGAEVFFCVARGETAREAFNAAKEDALYEHGHAGYTGTIAEKNAFTEIPFSGQKYISSLEYAEHLIDKADRRVDNKWGPAGCIEIPDNEPDEGYSIGTGPNRYLFFGWASC